MIESKVYPRSGTSGHLIEASLFDEVTPDHLDLWDRDWVPAMQAFCAGKPPGQKPEDSHWDWRRKSHAVTGILGYHSFALLCQKVLQGLMMTNDVTSARLSAQFGKPLIYVAFVATAPWNRPTLQNPPRYRGVGHVFVLAAIETSRDAEALAVPAGIDPEEVLQIEYDPHCEPELDAVFKLAAVFGVPPRPLLELAGLVANRTPHLREEAIRFAARSESIATLSDAERQAFEAFVTTLSEMKS